MLCVQHYPSSGDLEPTPILPLLDHPQGTQDHRIPYQMPLGHFRGSSVPSLGPSSRGQTTPHWCAHTGRSLVVTKDGCVQGVHTKLTGLAGVA